MIDFPVVCLAPRRPREVLRGAEARLCRGVRVAWGVDLNQEGRYALAPDGSSPA